MQKFLGGCWCEALPKVWVTNTSVLCTLVICCHTFGSGYANNLLGILHCSLITFVYWGFIHTGCVAQRVALRTAPSMDVWMEPYLCSTQPSTLQQSPSLRPTQAASTRRNLNISASTCNEQEHFLLWSLLIVIVPKVSYKSNNCKGVSVQRATNT